MRGVTNAIDIVARPSDKHWSIRNANNGEILAHSEEYASKWNRNRAARKLSRLTGWQIVAD